MPIWVPILGYNSPDSTVITDPTIRSVTERFLSIGETVFDTLQGTAVNSSYFKREPRDRR